MKQLALSFAKHDSGATAVEYALMVAFIALAIIVAVAALGGNVNKVFENKTLEDALK